VSDNAQVPAEDPDFFDRSSPSRDGDGPVARGRENIKIASGSPEPLEKKRLVSRVLVEPVPSAPNPRASHVAKLLPIAAPADFPALRRDPLCRVNSCLAS
jgi:hypothetical protein